MIEEKELKDYLEFLATKYPQNVIRRLEKGNKVNKTMGLTYIIDNPNLYKKLGQFPQGVVPYSLIYESFKSEPGKLRGLFTESSEVPFSRVFNEKIGECLEKAVLVQLFAQGGRASFLISGSLLQEGDDFVDAHAYNVVFKEGKPFLLDAENPLINSSTGKLIPYIAPVLGIKEKTGDIALPQEWGQGRTYSIF